MILRSLEAARLAKDRLGAYLVGGIISGFAFQVIYNVTMSAGLAPVKGITLPLMSYGGSSLIATLASFRPHPQRQDEAVYELTSFDMTLLFLCDRRVLAGRAAARAVPARPRSVVPARHPPDCGASSMNKEMIISSSGHETRVAILEDDQVVEIFIERENQRGVVGNIYKGRVSKVLPGMQSSFVDIGLERDAFLYVTEVINPVEEFERLEAGDEDEGPSAIPVARRRSRSSRRGRPASSRRSLRAVAVPERAAGAPRREPRTA